MGTLICQKYNLHISKNFEKFPKLATKFDRLSKHAEYGFHKQKYIQYVSSGIWEGGG